MRKNKKVTEVRGDSKNSSRQRSFKKGARQSRLKYTKVKKDGETENSWGLTRESSVRCKGGEHYIKRKSKSEGITFQPGKVKRSISNVPMGL